MTDEKNMTANSPYAPWDLRRLPNFDFSEFLRTVNKPEGEGQTAEMSLEGTKRWFRLACPNGALVLNPLRVADTMAIFEARVFADADDRSPLASFTATKKADKAAGDAYIRAAQDAALEGALRASGFCLEVSLLARTVRASETAAQPGQTDGGEQPAGAPVEAPEPSPAPAPAQTDAPAQKTGDKVPLTVGKTAQQPQPQVGAATRPAPASSQPRAAAAPKPVPAASQSQAAAAPRPAPVAPQPHAAPAPESKDAAPVVDINTRQPVAASANAVVTPPAPDPAPAAASVPVAEPAPTPAKEALAEQAEPAPVTYTADMTVEEIVGLMTLEQAKAVKVQEGTCKGWTLEQVARDRPPSLKWLQFAAPFADNVLKAAAAIVLQDLELKKAG